MSQLIVIKTNPGLFGFSYFSELPSLIYGQDKKDIHFTESNPHLQACYVLLDGEIPVGRFAIYNNTELLFGKKKALCIGSYECVDDQDTANYLLEYAKKICVEAGYNFVIGPMNGSTWESYRFSLENKEDSFFMDLNQHCYYNEQFLKTGFGKIAEYRSNVDEDLKYDLQQLDRFEVYYKSKGASFRHLDLDNVDVELFRIAEFCNLAFANNFLFTSIEPMQFVKKYIAIAGLFDPELIWIVENNVGKIQAILFAIPDHNDPSGNTLVLKTMASLPGTSFKGVTTYLARKTNQLAKAKGYQKIIHALFIKDNFSQKASLKYATGCHKDYALYGINLLAI